MKLFKRRVRESDDTGTEAENSADHVEGERGAPTVTRAPSLQSRVSNVLAMGLMAVVGLGILTWYYARVLSKPAQVRDGAQAAARAQATGDVVLPPLGPIDPPGVVENMLGPPPLEPPPDDVPDAWLQPATEMHVSAPPIAPAVKSPQALALERKLAGPVVAGNPGGSVSTAPVEVSPEDGGGSLEAGEGRAAPVGTMAALLTPSVTPAVRARVLPTQRLLLPKGAFLDCTLETAIDSTLPGMVTCVTATDTFGVDGSVVLMERGTKLIGETRGQVQQGAARVFVLWTEARTPTGVVIPLASPGTDELGRSGLPGQVNRHFFERFGAAILISVIDGAIQREMQSQGGDTTVIYDPSASQDLVTEVLKSTVNIPPTVTKHNGDRLQVLVARDLDFRSVYELKPAHHE